MGWWVSVIGWWLPLFAAASLAWTLLKNVKAVLVISAIAVLLTFLVWGLPGFGVSPAPPPPVAAAVAPPDATAAYLHSLPRPAPPAPAVQAKTSPACVERPPIRNTFYLCAGTVPNPTEITPGTPSAEKFLQWYAKTHPQWADLAKPSLEPRPVGMPFDAQTPEAPTLCDVPPPQGRKFFYCDDYGRLHFAYAISDMASSDNFLVWYERAYPQYAAQVHALRASARR